MYIVGQVFAGNVLTLCFFWSLWQFKKHDYKAPWLAYAAFIGPLVYFLASWLPTVPSENLPPLLDAIVLR